MKDLSSKMFHAVPSCNAPYHVQRLAEKGAFQTVLADRVGRLWRVLVMHGGDGCFEYSCSGCLEEGRMLWLLRGKAFAERWKKEDDLDQVFGDKERPLEER